MYDNGNDWSSNDYYDCNGRDYDDDDDDCNNNFIILSDSCILVVHINKINELQ
jgi:hypothetical protein